MRVSRESFGWLHISAASSSIDDFDAARISLFSTLCECRPRHKTRVDARVAGALGVALCRDLAVMKGVVFSSECSEIIPGTVVRDRQLSLVLACAIVTATPSSETVKERSAGVFLVICGPVLVFSRSRLMARESDTASVSTQSSRSEEDAVSRISQSIHLVLGQVHVDMDGLLG